MEHLVEEIIDNLPKQPKFVYGIVWGPNDYLWKTVRPQVLYSTYESAYNEAINHDNVVNSRWGSRGINIPKHIFRYEIHYDEIKIGDDPMVGATNHSVYRKIRRFLGLRE